MNNRIYPHNLEYEKAVLGILIDNSELIKQTALSLLPTSFYRRDHERIFRLLIKMSASGDIVDSITFAQKVMESDAEIQFGGISYVMDLLISYPAPAVITTYVKEISRLAAFRDAIPIAEEAIGHMYLASGEIDEIISPLVKSMQGISCDPGTDGTDLGDVLDEVMEDAENTEPEGYATGFQTYDNTCGRPSPGDLIIIAARPGMGKTALAMDIAINIAQINGLPVPIFSLEMSRKNLGNRLLCSRASVPLQKFNDKLLVPDDWERILAVREEMRDLEVKIFDKAGITIGHLSRTATRYASTHGTPGAIVVDYLQLLYADNLRQNKTDQIGECSRKLKELAKDLGCPVICLAQLNREVEKRAVREPQLSDLKGSGDIEQDADTVIFIHRKSAYGPVRDGEDEADVIVAKRRNGAQGRTRLKWNGPFVRFEDINHNII